MATVGALVLSSATAASIGTAAVATIGTMATIGAAGVAGSLYSSRKARKQQKRAQQIQMKSAKLQSARQAVQQVRGAQIARAQILQAGENQGVGGSSGVMGGAGSATSQAGGNIGFANQLFGMQQSAQRLMQSANTWAGHASGIAQISNFGMQLAGAGAFSGGGSGVDYAAQHTGIANYANASTGRVVV